MSSTSACTKIMAGGRGVQVLNGGGGGGEAGEERYPII